MNVRGATSIAGTMRRLDRLGHVPARLDGGGPFDALTGDPLTALAGGEIAGAALEDVLALLGGADAGPAVVEQVPAGAVARPTGVLGAPVARPDGAVVPEAPLARSVAAAVPQPRAATDQTGARASRGPRPAVAGTAPAARPFTGSAAPASESAQPVTAEYGRPTGALSAPAQLGAATPVSRRAAGRSWTAEAPASPMPPVVEPPAPSPPERQAAPTSRARRRPVLSQATPAAVAGAGAHAPPEPDRPSAFVERRDAAAVAPARAEGAPPAPVEGLAGLVSWWDAQTAAGSDSPVAGLVPAPGRSAAWSVDQPAHEAARSAEDAFEGAPVVRLSLRSALEELLLAEARASGIEVEP
jgi:hypothetical protein